MTLDVVVVVACEIRMRHIADQMHVDTPNVEPLLVSVGQPRLVQCPELQCNRRNRASTLFSSSLVGVCASRETVKSSSVLRSMMS